MFTSNINTLDKMVRLFIGLVMLALAFTGPKTPWGFAGIILIITAFINFCPLYAALGISTASKNSD